MRQYTPGFKDPYPNGWENKPSKKTPVKAEALQSYTDGIKYIENYLQNDYIDWDDVQYKPFRTIGEGLYVDEKNELIATGTSVVWEQLQRSGTHIADVTIADEKIEVFAPTGGGGGSATEYGTLEQFEETKDSYPVGTEFIVTDDQDYTEDISAQKIIYDNSTSAMTATNVQDALDEVFQSVSDGKELVASAISDKGVPTLATDSFQTMADNIGNISGGGQVNVLYNALEIPSSVNYLQASYTPEKNARVIVIYHVNVGSDTSGTVSITGLDNLLVLASRGNTQTQGQYWVWLGDIKEGQALTCKWSLNTGSYRRACMTVIEV